MERSNILLLVGGIVLIVPLFISFILKNKRNYNKLEFYKKEGKYSSEINKGSKVENEIIVERIKRLEQEVLILKQENNRIIEEHRKNNNLINQNNLKNNSFKPVLNYNLFKEKNSTIIDLYEKGISKEEIAKVLNKSIREIDMVIKLVK
ncbi:hypothetical protein KQI88_13560 [Alkaliphilus sp. MSJ-5]|uniref:Helix-turn-helix domain-containing protein n=1 Tax=Alkaliphilus flagellatus TaxID=2841507 RepID=A0ABS6G4Z3_9FIRM|nr:hypothetical protein [Alkaliphilus flagellatus]MBU5677444.1 hypothetical protein [Alkaliphilus flagellatus]